MDFNMSNFSQMFLITLLPNVLMTLYVTIRAQYRSRRKYRYTLRIPSLAAHVLKLHNYIKSDRLKKEKKVTVLIILRLQF